jgi:hypothetical protein
MAERSGPEGEVAELELELLEDQDAQYVKVRMLCCAVVLCGAVWWLCCGVVLCGVVLCGVYGCVVWCGVM